LEEDDAELTGTEGAIIFEADPNVVGGALEVARIDCIGTVGAEGVTELSGLTLC